jgi:hypothetical protein
MVTTEGLQLAAICIAVILYLWVYSRFRCLCFAQEDFATVDEKASQFSEWMTQHPSPTYAEFIQSNPDSNIVEYTKLRELSARGQLKKVTAARALRV